MTAEAIAAPNVHACLRPPAWVTLLCKVWCPQPAPGPQQRLY